MIPIVVSSESNFDYKYQVGVIGDTCGGRRALIASYLGKPFPKYTSRGILNFDTAFYAYKEKKNKGDHLEFAIPKKQH